MNAPTLRQQLLELRSQPYFGRSETPWYIVRDAILPNGKRALVSAATVWKIAMRPPYEPRNAAIRDALGLDPESAVTFVDGRQKPRAQALDVSECECGRYFVSNHPRRRRCFICSPYRGGRQPERK